MSGYQFDVVDFINRLSNGIPPLEHEYKTFEIFIFNKFLSTNYIGNEDILKITNGRAFYKLPRDQQVFALTSLLNRKRLMGGWNFPKAQKRIDKQIIIDYCCTVFNCSQNDAKYYIESGVITEEKVMNYYYSYFSEDDAQKKRKR